MTDNAHRRIGIAVRALTATIGGYALTAAATALLAVLLAGPLTMQRADAAIIATMLSFAIYACAALWAFAAPSAQRAFGAMLALGGLLTGVLLLQGHGP
jgi:hypothetical protein